MAALDDSGWSCTSLDEDFLEEFEEEFDNNYDIGIEGRGGGGRAAGRGSRGELLLGGGRMIRVSDWYTTAASMDQRDRKVIWIALWILVAF